MGLYALFGGTLWVIFALTIDNALFLGTRKFGTPRENCILVAWGWETQSRLMWTKVLYLVIMYVSSFLFSMMHGVRQLRIFKAIDCKKKTMKDFVCMLVGIPEGGGSDMDLEKKLADAVANYAGVTVVGAS